ncbi:hypothetical protein ANN_10101 [Periplaneta americana]|uniref:Uncharacterized protein n=1 Tax=Periplaneta americana TaxID=6978 RepID=A0ABQ8TN42_PERAM|nr:hypothetical protein ANN_10101 [Periplaneta americana]
MAGLCEGGNEPPASLKASILYHLARGVTQPPAAAPGDITPARRPHCPPEAIRIFQTHVGLILNVYVAA